MHQLKSILLCLFLLPLSAWSQEDFSNIVVIDKKQALVRFLDAQTYTEESSLSIDGVPHELVLSPDKKTAYVPDYGDGVYGRNPNPGSNIAVIDLETSRIKKMIDISPYQAPHGVQVDEAGNLYVSCDISRKILVIDPETYTIRAAIDTEGTGHWLAVTPDGSKAYVANKKDRLYVSVIDLKEQKVVARVAMPNGTQGITISPSGDTVLAIDMTLPTVYKIDTTADEIVGTINLSNNKSGAWTAKYSDDAKWITVINAREATAIVVDAQSLQPVSKSISVGPQPFGIGYNTDKNQVVIANHGDGTLSVINLDSQQVVQTVSIGKGIEALAFY